MSPRLSHQPFSKNGDPVKSPLFENLVGGSTHPPPPFLPQQKGGGGAHYAVWIDFRKFCGFFGKSAKKFPHKICLIVLSAKVNPRETFSRFF